MEEKLETQTEATNVTEKEKKMEEKNTYQKPDFANEEKFSALTAVAEKSYAKIDILADVAKLCESEGVNEDFGKMLIDYYKFALDARQACPDRPKRAKSDLSNLQVVQKVIIAVEKKCQKFATDGLTAIQVVKFMQNSEWKEHSILDTPHPERTVSSVLSVASRKEKNDFSKEGDITKGEKGYICQYLDDDGKPAVKKPSADVDFNLLA